MNAKKIISFSIIIFLLIPYPSYAQIPSESTPSAELETNTNQENTISTEKQVDGQVTTGGNTGEHVEAISTGNATAEANLSTNLNTNIEGSVCNETITTHTSTEGTIDLSEVDSEECIVTESNEASSSATVNQSNEAMITNTVDLTVDTGSNVTTGSDTTIQTGTASAKVDIATMANTNVSGENGFFGVINLMEDHEGDIILPYELDFIGETPPFDLSSDQILVIQQINDAQVTNEIHTKANTGTNDGGEVTTGHADSTIQIVDRTNMNILNSSFLILDINTFGTWDGELQGWWGNTEQNGNTYRAYIVFPQENVTSTDVNELSQRNKAQVTNDISVETNTGNNSVEKGKIITGDSNIDVNISNMVNTNIAGNNWYYMVINIFDELKGNIMFPRPDLGVSLSTNTMEIQEGEEVEYKVTYGNSGLVFAKDTKLEVELPVDAELTTMTEGALLQDNKLIWDLQKLQKNTTGEVFIKIKPRSFGRSLLSKAYISTSMFEPNRLNNSSLLEFILNLVKKTSEESHPASSISEESFEEVTTVITALEKPVTNISVHNVTYPYDSDITSVMSNQTEPLVTYIPTDNESTQEVKGISRSVQTAGTFPFEFFYFTAVGLFVTRILYKFF